MGVCVLHLLLENSLELKCNIFYFKSATKNAKSLHVSDRLANLRYIYRYDEKQSDQYALLSQIPFQIRLTCYVASCTHHPFRVSSIL